MLKASIVVLIVCFLLACNQQGTKTNFEENFSAVEETDDVVQEEPEIDITEISEGKKLFILCAACHSLKKDETNKVGPNLHNFFGNKAAQNGKFKYSEELINSEIVWDRETLSAWIENPAKLVPNTSMAFVGIADKERRDILIDYLLEETK